MESQATSGLCVAASACSVILLLAGGAYMLWGYQDVINADHAMSCIGADPEGACARCIGPLPESNSYEQNFGIVKGKVGQCPACQDC